MESANHEFTWLSGRAQASVVQEAASQEHPASRTGVATERPTALPRKLKTSVTPITTTLHSSLEKPGSNTAAAVHKPTPLPRIFRRSVSATAFAAVAASRHDEPIYDLPPSPEGSVFYVATPKLPAQPVDKSIILEFDPILQNPSALDDVNLRLSRFFIDTPVAVTSTAAPAADNRNEWLDDGGRSLLACQSPSSTTTSKVQSHVKRSLSTTSSSSSSTISSSKDAHLELCGAGPANVHRRGHPGTSTPPKTNYSPIPLEVALPVKQVKESCSPKSGASPRADKINGRVANVYCDPPLVSPAPLRPWQAVPPSLPPRYGRDPTPTTTEGTCTDVSLRYALPFDNLRAPELPPKSPTRRKPQLPLGCTLSSVPPPPPELHSEFVDSITAPPQLPPTEESIPPSRDLSISAENPFYQFFQVAPHVSVAPPPPPRPAGGMAYFHRDVVSIIDSGSSESEDDGIPAKPCPRLDPPKFPPPLLPVSEYQPQLANGERQSAPVTPTSPPPSYSAVASPEMDVVVPEWPAAGVAPPIPVAAKRARQQSSPVLSLGGKTLVISSAPIYQNVLAIFGSSEGVYAKINRPGASEEVSGPVAPPPLPPRGRQRPNPPPLPVDPHAPQSAAAAASQLARQQLQDHDHVLEVLRCIPHCGTLFKIGRGRKDITQKYMVLERGRLQCFAADKTDNPQEVFEQSDLLAVARISDNKQSDLSCFALVTRICKDRPLLFGAKYPSEREGWIQHIVRSILPAGAAATTSAMNNHRIVKAGYLYLRLSVTGSWQTCWTVLTDKEFQVTLPDSTEQMNLDLRKVISLQELTKDPQMNVLSEDKPLFVVSYPAVTLYARSFQAFDTNDWFQRLQEATLTVGLTIEEQQLTHEGVPVIVDKCINFVGVYGIASKGIYRQSATNSKVAKLLELFRKDAQKVHLQQDDYSEHDIANTLKRFFRKLPDPLMTSALYSQWLALVGSSVECYRELLKQLPEINYNTLKKLIGHLHSVSRLSDQNLMDVINLAQVFGPTLLCNEGSIDLARTGQEIDVMADLIHSYAILFGVSSEELDKEAQIQRALQDLREAKMAQKPAGDIMVGVYVHNRQWGKCLNVKVSPSMSAYDLCLYATQHVRIKDRLDQLAVYEVVCDGELERPLHFSEMVLSVTLRWAGWADQDARNNFLMVKRNEIIQSILPMAQRPLSMFGELKFAELKSKSFKKYMFEFKNAKLAYYKDAKISQPLGSWNIEDITWYLGVESKRSPSSDNAKYSLTFVESKAVVNRNSKDTPYFGRCVCFSTEVEFHKWLAALLIGQYPEGLLSRYKPIDLLS